MKWDTIFTSKSCFSHNTFDSLARCENTDLRTNLSQKEVSWSILSAKKHTSHFTSTSSMSACVSIDSFHEQFSFYLAELKYSGQYPLYDGSIRISNEPYQRAFRKDTLNVKIVSKSVWILRKMDAKGTKSIWPFQFNNKFKSCLAWIFLKTSWNVFRRVHLYFPENFPFFRLYSLILNHWNFTLRGITLLKVCTPDITMFGREEKWSWRNIVVQHGYPHTKMFLMIAVLAIVDRPRG